jgi:hypothetical protein
LVPTARAAARLEVGGSVASQSDDALEVRVDLTNAGDQAAAPLTVSGELFAHQQTQRLEAGVPAGAARSVLLKFPLAEAQPGVHALLLSLEYASALGELAQTFDQPGYMLIAIGENAEPAVRLSVPDVQMDSVGRFAVSLSSRDGAPHRVSLRVRVPRGLRVDPPESSVAVPAQGALPVALSLFRVDAPWQSQQGLLVVATTSDGALLRTTAATGVVHVREDPARMPRLRKPLLALALVLLAVALAAELRRRKRA